MHLTKVNRPEILHNELRFLHLNHQSRLNVQVQPAMVSVYKVGYHHTTIISR